MTPEAVSLQIDVADGLIKLPRKKPEDLHEVGALEEARVCGFRGEKGSSKETTKSRPRSSEAIQRTLAKDQGGYSYSRLDPGSWRRGQRDLGRRDSSAQRQGKDIAHGGRFP